MYIWMYNITDNRAIQKFKQLATNHNIYMIYEDRKHGENKPTEDYQWLINSLSNANIKVINDHNL